MPSSSRYRPPRRPAPPVDDDRSPNGASDDDDAADLPDDREPGLDDAPAVPVRAGTSLSSAPPDAVLPDSAHRKREREKRVRAPRKHGPRTQGDLVGKEDMQGRRPGDRYVRVHRVQTDDFQRAAPGYLVATEEALEARSGAGRVFGRIKRALIGAPLTSAAAAHERLTKLKALAV
ncbi:MAG: hypothetical protein KC432_13350, partial [Thermomicrobiales bacterium]|nr:hypothetical protein [Thermomicrobiales bacterium]